MSKHGTRAQQLLRRRLFPATSTDPQTACTFPLLKSAQLLSLQSKLSLYDYYISVEQLTDATGTVDVNVSSPSGLFFRIAWLTFLKDRYKAFLRSLRMWRHIRMAKRGGRAYDSSGIEGTSPGELAVLCPACPLPSVNLPPNWHSVGKDLEYVRPLYTFLLLSMTFTSGTSTIRCSASMPAFGSSGGRFRATRKIRSWAPGMLTSSHGIHIASTSVVSQIRRRFVILTQYLSFSDVSRK